MKQMLIIVEHARGKVSDYKQQFDFIFQQKLENVVYISLAPKNEENDR